MQRRRGFELTLLAFLGLLSAGKVSQADDLRDLVTKLAKEEGRTMRLEIPKKDQGGAVVGCRVDIYGTVKNKNDEPQTELILADLLVVAVETPGDGTPSTVTFAISFERAGRLAVANKCEASLKVRSMVVPIKPGLAGGVLQPGNRVDVVVVTTPEGKEPSYKVVLEDLELLGHDATKDKAATSATLRADAQQAAKLAEAVKAGDVQLVLRPPAKKKADDKPADFVAVLVARKKLPAFEALKEPEKLFKVVQYLKGDEPRDAVTDFAQVKGQRLAHPLDEDQPLKKTDFLSSSSHGFAPTGDGERAVAVQIDKKSREGLRPRCRVDIYLTVKKDGEEPKTELIMPDVFVLAVDAQPEWRPDFVTVAATVEQRQRLAVASKTGEVSLKVRAMVVPIESGLAGGVLRPGDHVDVAVVKNPYAKEPSYKVVLEDLEFLGDDGTKDKEPTSATLRANAEQAAELSRSGNFHLLLRPPTKEKADDKQTGLVAVPQDMRGVAMKCDPKSLADGFILPGSRVDVIVRKPKGDKESATKTVGENLLVLAVDTNGDGRDKEPTSSVVTLAVPQGQVEKLLAGSAAGKVAFVLRPPTDK